MFSGVLTASQSVDVARRAAELPHWMAVGQAWSSLLKFTLCHSCALSAIKSLNKQCDMGF